MLFFVKLQDEANVGYLTFAKTKSVHQCIKDGFVSFITAFF